MNKRNILLLLSLSVACIFSSCEFVIKKHKLEYTEPSLYIDGDVCFGSYNDTLFSSETEFVFGQTHFFADTTYEEKEKGVKKSAYITINNGEPYYLQKAENVDNSFLCNIPLEKLPNQLDTLRLYASHSNFDEVATAYTVVPNIPIVTVKECIDDGKSFNLNFSLDFEERDKMHQFYAIIHAEVLYDVLNRYDTIPYTMSCKGFEFNDKRISLDIDNDYLDIIYGEDNYYWYLPFLVQQVTDKWGWPYDFNLKFYIHNDDYYIDQFLGLNKLVIDVEVYSYDAYLRLKTKNYYSDMLFSEPVQTYNNVNNGKGAFGVVYKKKYEFDLKEK